MQNSKKQYVQRCWLAVVVLLLAGCMLLPDHKDDFAKINDDFMLRVRWNDVPGAALNFTPEPQKAFREQFMDWEDLKVTEMIAERSEPKIEIDKEINLVYYRLEYYVLPRMVVRKKRFTLLWEKPNEKGGAWAIVEPFPDLK